MLNKDETIHARVTEDTKDKLIELASANRRSQTNMVEDLIHKAYKEYIEQKKNDQKA